MLDGNHLRTWCLQTNPLDSALDELGGRRPRLTNGFRIPYMMRAIACQEMRTPYANDRDTRPMKVVIAAIRTSPVAVSWFGIGSLVLLLIKIVWLNSLPAAFPFAPSLGTLVDGLLGANVAAYIFFIISFQLPLVIERRHVGSTVMKLADGIANRVTNFLQMIAESTGQGILNSKTVSRELVNHLFQGVSPNGLAPMARSALEPRVSWLGAMALHDEQCLDSINRLWRHARFLDSKLVSLVNEIEFSRHSAGMRSCRQYTLRPGAIQHSDLLAWADNYYDCYDSARRLEEYCEEYRSTYGLT